MHISLKYPRRSNIALNGIPLIHEATHWKYSVGDPHRRRVWMSMFYDERDRSGHINNYARQDIGRDKFPWTLNQPETQPIVKKVEDVLVESFGPEQLIEDFFIEYGLTPRGLRVFNHVRIEPGLNGPAYFHGLQDRAFEATAEDVAVTTELAYVISIVPGAMLEKLQLIETSNTLRGKIKLLANWDYIDKPTAQKILDKNWRRSWIERIKSFSGREYN